MGILFPEETNMVDFKGKAKILTSARGKETWLVDPKVQLSVFPVTD